MLILRLLATAAAAILSYSAIDVARHGDGPCPPDAAAHPCVPCRLNIPTTYADGTVRGMKFDVHCSKAPRRPPHAPH